MTKKNDHDHVNPNDHVADNDNGAPDTAAGSASGALVSLANLGTVLNRVDTSAVAGRSALPMLQFKRDGSGTWIYGAKGILVEDGSSWAANPLTFKRGYIAFNDNNRVVGERLLSVAQPMPQVDALPEVDGKWTEQWSVNLKCTSGTDAGTEVVYKPTTLGGIQALATLIEAIRDRINGGQHQGKVAPILRLQKDSYQHNQYGRVWTPALAIVDWMSMEGPAPTAEPPPTPASSEQPRRRRVS